MPQEPSVAWCTVVLGQEDEGMGGGDGWMGDMGSEQRGSQSVPMSQAWGLGEWCYRGRGGEKVTLVPHVLNLRGQQEGQTKMSAAGNAGLGRSGAGQVRCAAVEAASQAGDGGRERQAGD